MLEGQSFYITKTNVIKNQGATNLEGQWQKKKGWDSSAGTQ